jgi:hypothetical protein
MLLLLDVLVRLRLLARMEAELLFREYKNYPGKPILPSLIILPILYIHFAFPSDTYPFDRILSCSFDRILSYEFYRFFCRGSASFLRENQFRHRQSHRCCH